MQPVSLLEEHLKLLEENDYHVCEKSDGIRVIGLLHFWGMKDRVPIGSLLIVFHLA